MGMKEQKTFKVWLKVEGKYNCKDDEEALEMFLADTENSGGFEDKIQIEEY